MGRQVVAGSTPGDRGFEELFRREYAAVERVAYLIVGNHEVARELAQEGFTRAYARWDRLSRYDRPGAWVRRVVIRMACKSRGRGRRESDTLDRLGDVTARRATDGSLAADHESGDEVALALQSLPAKQRAAIVLTYYEDLPARDVADLLGCSESTVRVHLHDGRRRLAEALHEELPTDADATKGPRR